MHSQSVLLNGAALTMAKDGTIPALGGKQQPSSAALEVAGRSVMIATQFAR